MKTETIDGVQVTTCYGYRVTGAREDLEPLDSIDALRARMVEDTPAASLRAIDRMLLAKEDMAQRAIACSRITHPLQPGEEGYRGWIIVSRAEVRLQCCRPDSGIDLSPDGCAKAVNGWGRK